MGNSRRVDRLHLQQGIALTAQAKPIGPASEAPDFTTRFCAELQQLIEWRRDVRHFRTDPVAADLMDELLDAACLAPSVGNSQPWRFVFVESAPCRAAIRSNFQAANADALAGYRGERAKLYATLKLEGLNEAPVQLTVFCDEATEQGKGLGQKTMPETLRYSTVMAIHTLWLAARAHGLGVGWVSILEPGGVKQVLSVPTDWSLVAHLCVGWPVAADDTPQLQRAGWQDRQAVCRVTIRR